MPSLRQALSQTLVAAFMCMALSAHAAVTLVFAGDTVLDDTVGELIAQGGDPFSATAHFWADADIRIVNLECVIATKGEPSEKVFNFRAHPRVIPVLKRHFNAVALANNHSGDYGHEAFTEMLQLLQKSDLPFVGGGLNMQQAHEPLIFERKGLRIAILSYNEYHPRSFEAGANWPGIAWSEDEHVIRDIRTARRVHAADLVIPIMHWGWENELQSNDRQKHLARLMIDAGADAVIGGHPHVTQEVSLYQGKPIVYSVGNFVMKETDNDQQRQGWVLQLELDKKGVQKLKTMSVQLDMEGIPTPSNLPNLPCWDRSQAKVRACMESSVKR